jgi:hypothetical protein
MENFADAKNTMENLNDWANEVNRKAKGAIVGIQSKIGDTKDADSCPEGIFSRGLGRYFASTLQALHR